MVGVVHDDPRGRDELRAILYALRGAEGDPAFVALEYDEEFWGGLLDQRGWLADTFIRTFKGGAGQGDLSGQVATWLAATLGYEPDVGTEVFGERVPRTWLESGARGVAGERAANLLCNFMRYLKHPATGRNDCPWAEDPGNDGPVVGHLSAVSRDIAGKLPTREWDHEWERDDRWAATLARQTDRYERGWALIVIGAMHATHRDDHTLRTQLENDGRRCDVRFAGFQPPNSWGPDPAPLTQ